VARKKTGLSLGDKDGIETAGICYDRKKEKVPSFNARKGDYVITAATGRGVNNNAWIVLGRDRHHDACSGYGGVGHSGTGAIDIVVGRMTPVPMANVPDKKEKIFVDPMYRPLEAKNLIGTKKLKDPALSGPKGATMARLDQDEDGDLDDDEPTIKSCAEKGIFMDAARIYISQKADIDHYFGLKSSLSIPSPGRGVAPRSAIAMKADGVRIVAREGIKLVTMGNNGNRGHGEVKQVYNSMGAKINAVQGISLIAGNGYDANGELLRDEPLVKGTQLCDALAKLAGDLSKLAGIVGKGFETQGRVNKAMMTHTHGETFLGAITLTSPGAMLGCIQGIVESLAVTQKDIMAEQANIAGWTSDWATKGKSKFLSKYNTTN